MRNQTILLSILASLTASGCQQLECAEGTVERDGRCEPGGPVSDAKCGPFTSLVGDRCLPDFPPTVCADGAEGVLDEETGITTCEGGGLPPCGIPIGCPKPTGASKQTFCGQLYDFETSAVLGDAAGAPATLCDKTMPTASGPCALQMVAYDALRFAADPSMEPPLPVGGIQLDSCGRFKISEVETNGTGPFIGLGVDDAGMPLGGGGTTVTVAIGAMKQGMSAIGNLEHFIVKPSTVFQKWMTSGGPPLSMTAGISAAVFRKHKDGNPGNKLDAEPGVTITRNMNTVPNNDFYFTDTDQLLRTTIGGTTTGANGTVLVNNAVAGEGLVWSGNGGLGPGCRWDPHAGASIPGIVFIQIFKKSDIVGQTCND